MAAGEIPPTPEIFPLFGECEQPGLRDFVGILPPVRVNIEVVDEQEQFIPSMISEPGGDVVVELIRVPPLRPVCIKAPLESVLRIHKPGVRH